MDVLLAVIDKLSDAQLINTFENDRVQNVFAMWLEEKLSFLSTQDHTEFSDALSELSNESLNLE